MEQRYSSLHEALLCAQAFIILNIYSAGAPPARSFLLFNFFIYLMHTNVLVLAFSHKLHVCLSTDLNVSIVNGWCTWSKPGISKVRLPFKIKTKSNSRRKSN